MKLKIPVPGSILYTILCLVFFDFSAEILNQTFPILAPTIHDMSNHTLWFHYGITPTVTSISFLNSMITSAETVGSLVSLIFVFPFAETKGRKWVIIYLGALLTVVSAICQLSSAYFQASELFILSQFFAGVHHPLRTFLTFIFITECAPDKNRGFACTALIIFVGLVKMIMIPVASPSVFGNTDSWFVFPLTALISCLVMLIVTARFPESPKWLVCQNRIEEAADSIEYYHGDDCNTKQVLVSFEKEKNLTTESHITLRQVWEDDTLRQGLKVVLAYLFVVNLSTSNIRVTYYVTLHESVGFTVQEALNINLILSILFFPTQFASTIMIDSLGRRPVMLIANVLLFTMSCLMLATQFLAYFFGSSLLTKAVLFIGMTINSLLMATFPIVYSIFPPGFFAPFVVTKLVFGWYLYRHMPETKGRAVCDIIEDMDEDVMSRVTASIFEEYTPLIKSRTATMISKRNSMLITTSRSRVSTGAAEDCQ
ncbi:Protein CBG01149 [Caenorhabditis briggsae]|uniref:Protein CBG01149 n=1 Tax=Caenorhabditis briggsae TaxID=6238 RepID=A8WPP3_CAEBR|nr:Protein CBG01149 [Caenorhabditis briggsae]CAP22450.1 Protein CBG01149 [Caenorhabditis briggsae]